MKEEEKRVKEEKDVSLKTCWLILDSGWETAINNLCLCLQRLKAEKAEITRFLQKAKAQQAPKVGHFLFTVFNISGRNLLH